MTESSKAVAVHISLRGCFFFFQQVRHNLLLRQPVRHLWRMICKIILCVIYRSNPEVKTFCSMIAAQALLPGNDVRLGLENLKEIADEMPLMAIQLLDYVERVYVGSEGAPAQFPPSTVRLLTHVFCKHVVAPTDYPSANPRTCPVRCAHIWVRFYYFSATH